jgi:hypothetical protein
LLADSGQEWSSIRATLRRGWSRATPAGGVTAFLQKPLTLDALKEKLALLTSV